MRSARALQEAFGLRSTVAVLGFALRALGQQLEEGKLEELVAQHRAQAPARAGGEGGRPEGRRERPEGRGGGGGGGRWQEGRGATGGRGAARVDPFARPPRPTATPEPEPAADAQPSEEVPAEDIAGEANETTKVTTPEASTPSEPSSAEAPAAEASTPPLDGETTTPPPETAEG
jgi:hypothetical protein